MVQVVGEIHARRAARRSARAADSCGRAGSRATVAMLSAWLVACSGAYGPAVPAGEQPRPAQDAAAADGAQAISKDLDAGPAGHPDVDAFYIDDPAPPSCGPDGAMEDPPAIEGTSECPADKNRQGCACPRAGLRAACWPGRRQNRNHGICTDGMTTCQDTDEFGLTWGPCEGYVLPKAGVVQGPEACGCFSTGHWALSNLVPCIQSSASGVLIYSSHPDDANGFACDAVSGSRPVVPKDDWSESTLQVECAGQFKLCYTMKAGRASKPVQSDCIVMRSCIDVWYGQAGERQDLPSLPGWVARDAACAKRFVEVGGYGEMSVIGVSAECDPVDDGHGDPYVFLRTAYCDSACASTPDADGCKECSSSGSGDF